MYPGEAIVSSALLLMLTLQTGALIKGYLPAESDHRLNLNLRQQLFNLNPHGRHTLGVECKGGRSNSEYHKPSCSLLYSQLREQVNNARMEVNPLWRGPGNTHGFLLDGKSYLLLRHQMSPPFPV